jgi:uncharacterized membrane protein (UPF0127 family)
MRIVSVTDLTRGTLIGARIEVAGTSLTRLFGLLGRSGLDAGAGLWIKPSSGVHTFGMAFSIDVIGLDKQLRVIRLWPNLVPWRMTRISFAMESVIELPPGTIAQCRVEIGDLLQVTEPAV